MTGRRGRVPLLLYQYTVGLCDAITGLLLVIAPEWTLRTMGVKMLPHPTVFASYIGSFVFGVGLTYIWCAAGWIPKNASAAHWQAQWFLTALIRSLVALFITCEIAAGAMEKAWISVALFDGALAIIQWLGLGKGWGDIA